VPNLTFSVAADGGWNCGIVVIVFRLIHLLTFEDKSAPDHRTGVREGRHVLSKDMP